jgi:hypothetical protein
MRTNLMKVGETFALHDLLGRTGQAVFGAVLALNGVNSPHRVIKWQRHLTGELDVAVSRRPRWPDRITEFVRTACSPAIEARAGASQIKWMQVRSW